jgi:iron complex transport system permease protein
MKRALLCLLLMLAAAALALLAGDSAATREVVLQLRAPRVLAALASGAALGVAGLALQTLFRNPMADPYVLGTSGGAAVGGLGALLLGLAVWPGALAGAALALGLLWLLASRALRRATDDAPDALLLAGVMIAAFSGALVQLMLALVPDEQLRGAIFWLLGDLSGALRPGPLLLAALAAVALALGQRRAFELLPQGQRDAFLLGLNVRRAQAALLVIAGLAGSAVVASVGALGFVGLVAPHLARRLVGWRGPHAGAAQVLASAALGALLVLAADTLARTAALPLELPAGAVLALIGAPFFVWLLMHERRHGA